MKPKNFLSLLLTLLLLMPGSASSVYAEGADFGVYSEAILEDQMAYLGASSYQDMVTNHYAQDPGTGEGWWIVSLTHLRSDINYEIYRNALGEYIKNTAVDSPTQRQKDALVYLSVNHGKFEIQCYKVYQLSLSDVDYSWLQLFRVP